MTSVNEKLLIEPDPAPSIGINVFNPGFFEFEYDFESIFLVTSLFLIAVNWLLQSGSKNYRG